MEAAGARVPRIGMGRGEIVGNPRAAIVIGSRGTARPGPIDGNLSGMGRRGGCEHKCSDGESDLRVHDGKLWARDFGVACSVVSSIEEGVAGKTGRAKTRRTQP